MSFEPCSGCGVFHSVAECERRWSNPTPDEQRERCETCEGDGSYSELAPCTTFGKDCACNGPRVVVDPCPDCQGTGQKMGGCSDPNGGSCHSPSTEDDKRSRYSSSEPQRPVSDGERPKVLTHWLCDRCGFHYTPDRTRCAKCGGRLRQAQLVEVSEVEELKAERDDFRSLVPKVNDLLAECNDEREARVAAETQAAEYREALERIAQINAVSNPADTAIAIARSTLSSQDASSTTGDGDD